jgi:hydroxyethylthiazole kinase-like uncharacterized protein yjeF
MIPILTTSQMRAVDTQSIADNPTVGYSYMLKAGAGVLEAVRRFLGSQKHGTIAVLCGKGNNGGDGYVAAYMLRMQGYHVSCFGLCDAHELSGEARMAYDEFVTAKGHVTHLHQAPSPSVFERCDLIIDALLGTGVSGNPRGTYAEIISLVNTLNKPVLAVDTPSGLDSDTGAAGTPTIRATTTVTMGFPKIGQLLYPGRDHTGHMVIHDLGYPADIVNRNISKVFLPSIADLTSRIPVRKPAGSKFDHGLCLLACGSRGMTGSAALAAQAALRSGCGMVHIAAPADAADILSIKLLEPVIHALPQTDQGGLGETACETILVMAARMQAALIGPGLSHHPETGAMVRSLIARIALPCVLDADGINAFKGCAQTLKQRSCELVLTPHAGEWERLFEPLPAQPAAKIERLSAVSREYACTIAYKGNPTIVTSPDGTSFIVTLGNSGMATAGSGDVLSGIIVALIAQGCTVPDAALAGVMLHGLSGEAAAQVLGEHGLVAGDLLHYLPGVLKSLSLPIRTGILP